MEANGEIFGVTLEIFIGSENGEPQPFGHCANEEVGWSPSNPTTSAPVEQAGSVLVISNQKGKVMEISEPFTEPLKIGLPSNA